MNIDFVNDLINRLIAAEGATNDNSLLVWTHDECLLDIGQDSLDSVSSQVTYRIQRLPKLSDRDRRPFLVKCSRLSTGDSNENEKRRLVNSDDCVCQQQLSYSACLNFVHERQQELSWLSSDDRTDKEEDQTQVCWDGMGILSTNGVFLDFAKWRCWVVS